MARQEVKVVLHDFTRNYQCPDWREVDLETVNLWKEAQNWLTDFSCDIGSGSVQIEIDLTPCINRVDLHARLNKLILDDNDHSVFGKYEHDIIELTACVKGDGLDDYAAADSVRILLYEMFITMNLAVPGSLPSMAYVVNEPERMNARGVGIRYDVSLNARAFDNALADEHFRPWLHVGMLQFSEVLKWYSVVAPRGIMVPQNQAAKCLFALMHLAKVELGPANIAWIFYALEGLFDCQVGENSHPSATNKPAFGFAQTTSFCS